MLKLSGISEDSAVLKWCQQLTCMLEIPRFPFDTIKFV